MVGSSKVVERRISIVNVLQTSQQVLEITRKKSAMNVQVIGQSLVGLIINEGRWVALHNLKHLVAIVANHLSVTPCNSGRQQRHYLDIAQRRETTRKLHRIASDEIHTVDSSCLTIEKLLEAAQLLVVD